MNVTAVELLPFIIGKQELLVYVSVSFALCLCECMCLLGPERMYQHSNVHSNPGPAPPVRPVRPWPYQFLRRKNGVAGILTYERVASYIPLRLPPVKAATIRPGQTAPCNHESWCRFSWSRGETNTHGMETGLTRSDGNLQATRCS